MEPCRVCGDPSVGSACEDCPVIEHCTSPSKGKLFLCQKHMEEYQDKTAAKMILTILEAGYTLALLDSFPDEQENGHHDHGDISGRSFFQNPMKV